MAIPFLSNIDMNKNEIQNLVLHSQTSDPTGSTPEDDPFTVDNYAATAFSLMGIDPRRDLLADGGRPIRVVNNNVIEPSILK